MVSGKPESFQRSPSTPTSNKVYLVLNNVFYTEEDAKIFVKFLHPTIDDVGANKLIKVRYANSYINKIKNGYKWYQYKANRERTDVTITICLGPFNGFFKQTSIRQVSKPLGTGSNFTYKNYKSTWETNFFYSNLAKDKESFIMEAEQVFLQEFLNPKWFQKDIGF